MIYTNLKCHFCRFIVLQSLKPSLGVGDNCSQKTCGCAKRGRLRLILLLSVLSPRFFRITSMDLSQAKWSVDWNAVLEEIVSDLFLLQWYQLRN